MPGCFALSVCTRPIDCAARTGPVRSQLNRWSSSATKNVFTDSYVATSRLYGPSLYLPAFCTTYGSVPFLQIVDVYVLPTLIWNASSGTFACSADTSVNSL